MRTVPVQKNLRLATMGNEHSREDGEAGSRPSDGETDAMSGADDGYLSRGDTDDSDLSGEEQRRRKGFVVDPKFLNAALRGGSTAVATAVGPEHPRSAGARGAARAREAVGYRDAAEFGCIQGGGRLTLDLRSPVLRAWLLTDRPGVQRAR